MPLTLLGPAEPLMWGTAEDEEHRNIWLRAGIFLPKLNDQMVAGWNPSTSHIIFHSHHFCSVEQWCQWSETPALIPSCSVPGPWIPEIPSPSTVPGIKQKNESDKSVVVVFLSDEYLPSVDTCSCCTLFCRPSVFKLASLSSSCSCAVCSHLRREPESPRNCSSCCSQSWRDANLRKTNKIRQFFKKEGRNVENEVTARGHCPLQMSNSRF